MGGFARTGSDRRPVEREVGSMFRHEAGTLVPEFGLIAAAGKPVLTAAPPVTDLNTRWSGRDPAVAARQNVVI